MASERALTSAKSSTSARVYPATIGLPVVPEEPWTRATSSSRYREEPERVVVAQVVLARERQPAQVVERPHRGRIDSELVEPPPVEGDPFVHVARELLQPSRLERPQLRPRHRLGCRIVDHGGHRRTPRILRESAASPRPPRRTRGAAVARPRRPVWSRVGAQAGMPGGPRISMPYSAARARQPLEVGRLARRRRDLQRLRRARRPRA